MQIIFTARVTDRFGRTSQPFRAEGPEVFPAPVVDAIEIEDDVLEPGQETTVTIVARGEGLSYELSADAGTVTPTAQANVFRYRAPA